MAQGSTKQDTAEAWNQFCDALAAVLAELEEDQFLILIAKSTDHFVQFAAMGEDGMRAEAQSNTFIEEAENKLSSKARQHLLSLGWNKPTYVPSDEEEEPPDGSSNYYIDADTPIPYSTLAGLAVATLQQIHGVHHPRELKYSAFSYEGDSLHFSDLRIKRGRN